MFRSLLTVNHRREGAGNLKFQQEPDERPFDAIDTTSGHWRTNWRARPIGPDVVTYAAWFEREDKAVSATLDMIRALRFEDPTKFGTDVMLVRMIP